MPLEGGGGVGNHTWGCRFASWHFQWNALGHFLWKQASSNVWFWRSDRVWGLGGGVSKTKSNFVGESGMSVSLLTNAATAPHASLLH